MLNDIKEGKDTPIYTIIHLIMIVDITFHITVEMYSHKLILSTNLKVEIHLHLLI